MVHSRDCLLTTSSQTIAPAASKSTHVYTYPPIPRRVGVALAKQLRARGAEVVLGDRLEFPDHIEKAAESSPHDTQAWDGTVGLLPHLQRVSLKSGDTIDVDNVFVSTGNKPNSGLVAAVDKAALTSDGYVAVDGEFCIVSDVLESYYALGDVASQPGRKTSSLASIEAASLAKILLATIKADVASKQAAVKPYTKSSLNAVLIPLGDGVVRGGPGDGVGAGAYEFGWLGTWKAPKWVLKWMAKEYFAEATFYRLFMGATPPAREQ